jgi:transposase
MKENESWLSDREIEIADTMCRFDSVEQAARELDISAVTIYTMLFRIRKKLTKSRFTVNKVNNWKKSSRVMARLLVPYYRLKISVEEGEIEE